MKQKDTKAHGPFMFIIRAVLLAGILLLLPFTDLHAESTQTRRPVVGIALSGGSALGLAHIGVLRYLEERRIPIDRIAGTSMGGLLAGLYATGHDAAVLERIVKEADWDDLLRTRPKFEDRSVAEKQEWNRIDGKYSIQLGNGLSLPAGFNAGAALVLMLSRETAAYWDVRNFDDLPIPFRCVATDLLSGEAFVLREGFLPKALRATMALPAIFTPVDWDGRVLSDGGIVNNLPTDVVKAMGADFIIGVTLRVGPTGTHDLRSMLEIFRQSTNIAVVQNELRNIPIADLEISVQLGNRDSMDFSDAMSIIQLGYNAAAQHQTVLEKLSLPPQEWEEHIRARKARERTLPASGPVVDVSSTQPSIRSSATSELMRKTSPAVSGRQLVETLSGIMAATGLPNAYYGWHEESGGRSGFEVQLEPRRNIAVVVSPYLFYQLSPGEPGRPTFRLSGAAIPKDAYKSRFLFEANLGENPAVALEYYRPFGGSAYFVAPGGSVAHNRFFFYTDDGRIDSARDRFAGSFYFGAGTWRYLQLRVGAAAGYDKYSSPAGDLGLPAFNTGFFNPEIVGTINNQDSGQLPSRGSRLNGSAGWSFREHSFPYVQANFDHFQPVSGSFSLFGMGQADSSLGRRLTFYDKFFIGGLTQLDAFRYQELRAETLLAAGGGVLYRGFNPVDELFRPVFGTWYEAARLTSVDNGSSVRQSATAGMFMPTPVGLLGLTFSVDLQGSTRFRFSIGSFWNRP